MGTHRITPSIDCFLVRFSSVSAYDWLVRACACTNVASLFLTRLRCAAQPSQAQRQYSRWKKWCSPRRRTTLLDFPFPAAGPRSRDRMVASTWGLQLIAADFKIVRPLTGELAWVQLNACTCIIGDRDFVLSILDFLEKMIQVEAFQIMLYGSSVSWDDAMPIWLCQTCHELVLGI